MTILFLLIAFSLPIAFIALVIAARRDLSGRKILPLLATATAAPMIGFCVFGFLASGEASGLEQIVFRLVYSLLIVLIGTGALFAWKPLTQS